MCEGRLWPFGPPEEVGVQRFGEEVLGSKLEAVVAGELVQDWLDGWGVCTTDQEGRFRASNLPSGMPFRIEIRLPRQYGAKPVVVLDGQKANGPEVGQNGLSSSPKHGLISEW